MALLALFCTILAFALLALGMDRHHRDIVGAPLHRAMRSRLRLAGAASLGLAWLCSVTCWGLGFGSVAWFGLMSAGAAIAMLAVSFGLVDLRR